MTKVAVIGLGYVGLPLAVEFGKKMPTGGVDMSAAKVAAYREFFDPTGEVSSDDLRAATHLTVTTDGAALKDADFIIVAVPTPVDDAHQPDFSPLVGASETCGRHTKRGATVVFESTVYPGATEEICIPVIEKFSGMKWLQDFNVGYSPERINPGDKERTVTKIVKVVSGDTPDTLRKVADVYKTVITAGVYEASSIKVAEAAKVIENTQRDLNIAFVNELAIIFGKLGIDTEEVLRAAGTKWPFRGRARGMQYAPGIEKDRVQVCGKGADSGGASGSIADYPGRPIFGARFGRPGQRDLLRLFRGPFGSAGTPEYCGSAPGR